MIEDKLTLTIENAAGWDPEGWRQVLNDAAWSIEGAAVSAERRKESKSLVLYQLRDELHRLIGDDVKHWPEV